MEDTDFGLTTDESGFYLSRQECFNLGPAVLSDISNDQKRYFYLSHRAEAVVDRYTFKRVRAMSEVPEAVKRCVGEIIMLENEVFYNGPALKSFSSDGYSETYAEPMTRENLNAREYDLCMEYLANVTDDTGTPLLYMGV